VKSHTRYLEMNVPARLAFVNITGDIERAVAESGVAEGLCLVNAMHITASVFIAEERALPATGGGRRPEHWRRRAWLA